MSAKDRYHDCVRNALVKDGWIITHDPLRLPWGKKDLYVDLGAEQLLAAEKGQRQIAVEIKSFLGRSEVADLEKALGQFVLYRALLAVREPSRTLFLAVPHSVLEDVFDEPIGQVIVKDQSLHILGFDPQAEEITRWIP
jgi:XisH protein